MRDVLKILMASFLVYACMASCSGDDAAKSTNATMGPSATSVATGAAGTSGLGQGGASGGVHRDSSAFDAFLDALGDPVGTAEAAVPQVDTVPCTAGAVLGTATKDY